MKKKISLVTGGAGFIGSHTVDNLIENNYEVRVIDNLLNSNLNNLQKHNNDSNLKFENLDINKVTGNEKIFNDVDYVFHFAGIGDIVPSIENPKDYFKTNLNGTINILEGVRNKNIIKLVYAASSSCYGLANTPTDEFHKINTEYPYALSKYLGEQATFHWGKVYKLNVNSIRIFNAYGRRVKTKGAYGAVFGVFFKQKLEAKPLTIVGDGKQTRDFIYVTDIADAFFKLSTSQIKNDFFNLGTGKPQTINYLAKLIGGEIIYIPKRPGEPDSTWADITKIKKMANWKPKINFEKGVKTMINNIQDWKDSPLWDKNSIELATKKWFEYLG